MDLNNVFIFWHQLWCQFYLYIYSIENVIVLFIFIGECSMKIKIAEIADIHFGFMSTATLKLYNNLKKYFIDWLKENSPDVNIIAICGDLFHLKLALTSNEAICAVRFIQDLRQEFPNARIILVKGTRSHDLNQLEVFNSMVSDNFKIYNTVEEDYYTDNFKYLVIPEEYYPDKSVYDKYLKSNEKYDWVFFHGMFSFAGSYALMTGNKFNKICFTSNEFDNCVYGKVVGGHIHIPLEDNKIQYCGSFERWKHGEEDKKGFRYHEYDTNTKKVIVDKYIENVGASIYKTLSFKDFDCDDLQKLVNQIKNKQDGCTSLRIKISKNDTITDIQSENLVAACMQFNNVVLFKENSTVKKSVSAEDIKASEDRKKRISEYDSLSFNEITIKYARDVLGKNITDKQIQEVLE